MVPFRAWIIRLGSMCVQFHGSVSIFILTFMKLTEANVSAPKIRAFCIQCGLNTKRLPVVKNTTSGQSIQNKRLVIGHMFSILFKGAEARF